MDELRRWRSPLPRRFTAAPFAVSEALAQGISRKQLRRDNLDRPFHGIRSVGLDLTQLDGRCRAYAEHMHPSHAFSHSTAAQLMGLPLPDRLERDPRLHVSAAAPGRAPQMAGIVGHRHSDGAVIVHRGLRTIGPAATWASLATQLDIDDLVAVGDALVSGDHPWTTIEQLGRSILPGMRGATKLRIALALIRTGVRSRPETHLRLAIVRVGLPEPVVAHPVWVPALQRIVHPDLSWPDWRVGLEYEGEGHRTDRWQFQHDIKRVEGFVDIGWSLSRFTSDDVYRTLQQTLARIRLRLSAHGWPQQPPS